MSRRLLLDDGRNQRELVIRDKMTIGRDPACDISDADPRLSRRHAEFLMTPRGLMVRDLDSRNGVRVNGRMVQEALLTAGDLVELAHLSVRFVEDTPTEPAGQAFPSGIRFEMADGSLVARRVTEDPELAKYHGLARSLVANAVAGVTDGFKRELDIVGVGYRAELKGKQVIFALGYSHAVVFDIPNGIDVAIDKQTHITVTGVDRQLVGQVAANIRRLRKPDPYKQKGVRYTGEVLKKKAGKTGAK